MGESQRTVTHVPVVGAPSDHPHGHAVVIFDAETGLCIGHAPNYRVEQTSLEKKRGVIVTEIQIRHIKDIKK